ncbi:uncharacterized protein LOC107265744 isoform X2 [Cephus cinctus]|uniref:Uncharacterized protein LOC107265744 isoform X2 n=1 Tax=Cephus cinctus TaxID=211228 RepID=A0AAJ7BPD3_CEPCN|nr:uncharacterized protein LOC107265744 isoform X2 [Cephus cinctus]
MSGSGFRGRGFGSRGIRPRGPSGVRGGPRFPPPHFNRPSFPRHGSENWHEHPAQPFCAPWQYNGRGHFPNFQVRPPFRHDVPFHHGRGRGPNVRGMPPRMRMPGAPGLYRPELQSENEVYASPSYNEQHESSANLPQISSAPPLGSEEERQQKITEAADKLKQKLSSIKNQEVENFWEEDVDLIPSKSIKEAPNKEVAELHPHDFNLTYHDLKDIGRVDLHRTPMQDDSVVVLDEVCNRNLTEIPLLDEERRNSEGESECNIPNNAVKEEVDNVQENAIDKDITNIPTIDSTVVQSRENTTLQTHQDTMLNFAEEIPHHNPSVSFNCRPEFHRGNVNTPPRFIPRQMGPRFRMPYPQEMSPMGRGKPLTLRPMHPNSRPPNQHDMPRVMFNHHTPSPAVFNRLPPPSNFHSMDQNLNIDTLPQMQADPMHSGVRFNHRGPPPHLSSPSNIQCNSSNEERMNFPDFDPRKPPPSVITQEEVPQLPPVFDPRLSFQERQRLIPTVVSAQLHPPLSMQVPSSTIPPPPPLSGPPPPPAPPGSLLEMVPMTDFDLIPNYSMTNNFDMAQSHFLQLDGVQPLSQQEALEPEQNYIDIEGELYMEPPPEPPILSDYCSPPLPETLPPADAPLPPVDAPLPPPDAPLPPVDAPLPPLDAPLPPADVLLPSTEVPLPISESRSVLFSKKQGSKTSTETSEQQEPPRVSKETILPSTSRPKTDMDKPKQKRLRMKKSKSENIATCSAPTMSMSPTDKVHTVQNQDNSKQYQNTLQEDVPLSEEQSRPKVVFNLNAKIKKISKQEEWQQQTDTSTAKHRKLKAQIVALENPANALRVKSHSQIRKMPSPKSSKPLISSRKRSEARGRVSESSWKSTVIDRFLKMSKNEIRNILNNSSLRKFDIAMKQLVKERRSSLSWEMRNTEDEKIKSYDREQFICQLNEMLDPSATIDITNLPTEFIRHLGEVLQLNSLPQDQTDSIQNTEAEVTPVHTTSKSQPAESTYDKLHGKTISRSLMKKEIDISMNANEVHEDTTINNVQINVEQSKETQDSRLNMDLDNIFLAGGRASQSPMVTEPVPETKKFQEGMTFVESRKDKCERWHRKARDDPDMFRNLTKEEWEAKYGKSNNDDEIGKPPSRLDSNESSSNKEDISIDSIKSLAIKNVIDRNPKVGHSNTVPVNKYVLNIAKSSSLRQEYQSNKGRSSSDSNSMAVAEVIESISPIEMSGTTWRERSSETCQTIGKTLRETKSGEDSNESTSETRRDKLFTKIGSNRKHREGMSSSRKSRRRERKRKTRKEKERRKRKRRVAPRESSSSYSDSESDSMTLFTELDIKKEIIVKDEPGLEKVECSVEKTINHPEPTECNHQSAQQELTIDKTLLSNKTIVTNQEPVTNKDLITSQELSTTQECTSNEDTSLQMRKQSMPTILEMPKVPNIVLMEFPEKESTSLKTIDGGNNANSQALDTIASTKPLESTSETSHSAQLDMQKEEHSASTSRSAKNKVLDKSKQEKNDITSVTVLPKDVINISQKSDKPPKDTVPEDAENVRSSNIDQLSVEKSGEEAADKVDIGNGTIRSKSNEEKPSMKFQNIKSEGRKEMKLIEEKAKKKSSSLLRDKKSSATKHSKMLTTELKSLKVKIQKEKASSGTADSSEHKKQSIQIQIPTEDNPDLKDPRLSKLKERVQQSPNKSARDCHSNIFSEKFSVESTTEEQEKQQTQHSQSTLTTHGNINKTLRDIEQNVQTPLTVEACTVDFNAKAAKNTSSEVTSLCSLDSPFKGFSEESQLPSEQLARNTLLRSQAEFLNGATVSDESIPEETCENSALCVKTTSPNEDSSLQSQETTSPQVLPEKSEELQSKDVTNLLVISASGDISDIQKDESIEVHVSSDSLNGKAKSEKLIINKETHVEGMCIETGTRIDENIEQDKVYENIIDTVKSPVEKLQDVDTLKKEHLEKETSEIVEKLEPAKIFDPIITLEQEGIKGLEVAEVGKVEKSSAVVILPELAETSKVEKVAQVAKKYELFKIDTTVKPIVVTKEQEVEESAVAENLQEVPKVHELAKATEPLKVLDVVKSSSMGKSNEKVSSHEAMKIHEGVKLSVTKKKQERHKPHEMVKTYDTEKLRVAEKTQEVTKIHGSKRLETVKTSKAVKSSMMRKTRDRYKVCEIAKIDEAKQSTAVEKTQEFAKLDDMKKELEVVKPFAVPKRHDLVETPGVEKKSEVIESSITLKRHDIEKSAEVEKLTEVSKSPIILKGHEVVNSPDVQKIPEVERAHEIIKPPVVLKRHDFLKSHEALKLCEVEEMVEVGKASVLLKRYDSEKIPEIVKPSVLLRRLDVKSPMTKKIKEEVKPFVAGKSHEVVNSPTVEKAQEVVKPPTILKRHEEVKSPPIEKEQEVVKPSTALKRHKEVKSPVAEKTQEVIKPSITLKRHKMVKSPVVEKGQEAVTPSTTLKRHEVVKSPIAEKEQELVQSSTTSKRHEEIKSPIVEKTQEVIKPSTTLKRHKVVKSPVIEKGQETVTPSTTLIRHEVVKSPIAEKEQELVKPSTTSERPEELKSPVVEKLQEVIKPSTTSKRHEVVKSPVIEKGQETVTPSTTLIRHEVVKSPIAEKEEELVQSSTTSKRHEEIKSPVVEKTQEGIKPSKTLKRHKVVKSPVVEKGQEAVTPSTTLKRHEVIKSPIAEKEQELVKPSTTSERPEELKSPVVEKLQEVIKPSTTSKRHEVVKSPVIEKGQEAVTPSTTLKRHEVVKSPITEKEQVLVKPSTTSKRHEEVKSPVIEKGQEPVTPSTTLKRHKVVKSPVVEKGQEVVTLSTTLKRHEVVKSPIAEREQELVKRFTSSKRYKEVKSPVVEKLQEVIKPSKTLKRHKVVKSPVVEKCQETVTPSTTLKRHEVVKSPIAEKEQEVVKPSTISKRHEEVKSPTVEKTQEVIKPFKTLKRHKEVKSPVVGKTEEVINSSTTLERHEVVNLPVAEKKQELVKPSEAFKSYESPEMEKLSGVIKIQQQVKIDEITKTEEVAKLFVEHMKAHEVSELHEPSASTSKSLNSEVTQTQAEINVTKSQDALNHHHEKSQEILSETGVSYPSVTKGQSVDFSESSKCEEKITKRRRVSRWQDNDDIPKVIEPIQYVEKPKIRSKTRKESKKHDNDPLHKIRSRQKFKDKKSKAPTKLDKILSRENAMTKESVMSRMIEIDLEIHKLMTEKMTLYQQLNSESSLLDDNQANTKDNHESRSKKRKEVSAVSLFSHNRLSLEKGHPPTHQSTHGARNKDILFDDSQADHDNSRKDTLVHVFDNSYEKRERQTSTSISEAKQGRSVDHVNIEIDKSSFPPENNKEKKRLRLDKPDIEKTHNKSITDNKESLNALKNYKKMISKPDKKTDNDIATVREVRVESKSCTSPKYPKGNDDSTNVEENVLEDQYVTRITEDRPQPSVGVDEESKSSENVSKRSDSKTTERLSIYSDDSTRESSLTLESSEAKKCTTGLALLEETFKREMAISRKLKAAARKQKKEKIETLLKNVNSLTADEEEIPLNVLFEMKQKQKQHLLEEMGVKSKLEKLPEKSQENSATIWKHVMAVINAVAENKTENVTVETHELEVPNLGQLVELSTEQTLLEVETTVKPTDTDKIDNTGTLETMTLISKNILEPTVSVEIASPASKAAELHTLIESRHEDLVHTENTPASTENTEKDLIGKDSKKEKSDIQSDTLSENEVKELSAKVAIDDTTTASVKNDHDKIISNENKRLTGGEDEQSIHEIGKTTEAEKEDEDSSAVLNKKSSDNIECPGTLMDSEGNSINETLTSNLDNTVISAETENEAADSTILDVQKDKVIVSPEKESATEMKEVDPTIISKEDLNTSLELESFEEIHEAVKETMDDLINSVPESSSAETISRGNEDCSQKKKEEERPVESEDINSQTEELNRSGSNDFLGFLVSNQTSVEPTEKTVQLSTSTSEEIETTAITRSRGRPKKRLNTNSSLSGTISPVPATSTIPEKRPKNVQSRGKRKSIVVEPRTATKRRKTRWSNRSTVELPGLTKDVNSLETSIDAELLSSKGFSIEESKKRKYISQLQLKNCKVRLTDCKSTYLRPDCDPSLFHQYGISKINAYGRTICIQCEPSLKIEGNKRSASVTLVQEVITPGYDIIHMESDKEKDSSSFCSWDQNIQELPESIDVSQNSISQEKMTRSRKIYNNETTENCEDTNDNEHVYLSHLDPTVLRQDEVSSPQPVIDINEDESAANTSSQSDIEILEATKESRSLNQVEDTDGEKMLTKMVLEEEKSPRTEYTVHKGPVLDIKVYGDSFMAASEDGTIYRYSQVSNGILNIYRGHKSAVTCLCIPKINFSGISRQWLFSGSLDGTLRCYEIDSGQQVRESVDIGSPIQCMDHAWGVIFLGTKSGHVSRFHIKSGVMKGDNIQFSEVSVLALKATSEGPRRVLIVASRNQPITIRDAQNGLFLRTVSGHKNHTVYSLMMDHHMVYCGTSGTLIPVFDFITAEQVAQYNAGVGIVCMRLYKKLLFAGCYDGNIYVFNTKDRKLVCSIPGPGNMLLSMEVVDNKIIAGSKDRGLHIWLMPKAVRALINNRSRNARMKEI